MRITLKSAAMAMALVGATFASTGIANAADVAVGFNVGDVAAGYSDGYRDHNNQFHPWAHPADAKHYRAAHKTDYHSYRHDDPKHQ